MGGLQGWHLAILMLIVVVVVAVVVVVIAAASRPRVGAGAAGSGGTFPGAAVQIGYTMDGQPLYQQPVSPPTNLLAILALVLGLFTGILGIIFGHIARAQIRRTGEGGAGLALAGLVIGYVWLSLLLLRIFL